jgi:hypothetical protein
MFARRLLIGAVLCVAAWGNLHAGVFDSMEKALMPGELSAPHAKFEEDCTNCHKFFGQEHQNNLCLDCHDHKNIAEDIQKGQGFHGRIPDVKNKDCRVCHSEHKGRQHSIVLLDKQTFDHRATDFPLRGRHSDAPCQACHKKDKKTKKPLAYHEAPTQCIKCHKKDDAHDGRLGKQCGSCHAQTRWQDFRFDHSVTKFKLEGKHKGVECRNCHPQQRYSGAPKKCFACHQRDDKHKGKYGEKCQDCHTVSGWGSQKFDHDKDTDYPLKGRHKSVTCQQCHRSEGFKKNEKKKIEKLSTDCYACHRLQDEHKEQYGRKCKDCHTVKGWKKLIFDHKKTDFPLKGKHEDVACGDCHKGILYKEDLKLDCFSCHRQDDVHREQQGKKCQDCHNEKGWQHKVAFDHNLVKFPLLGAHAALACEECHSSGSFKDTKAQCLSCHKDDDVHKRGLGPRCDLCHYVGDWKAWEFDHDKQTDFKLTGKHKGIVCNACHYEPVEKEIDMPSDCQSCHLKDDAHDGEFGRHCQRCHNAKSFTDVNM